MAKKKNQELLDLAAEDAGKMESIPDDDAIARLTQIAHTIALLEIESINIDERQKEITQELNKLKREFLPEAMSNCGMSDFTTVAGVSVKVKNTVYARLNKDAQARGFQWLMNNGLGSIIKNKVTATLAHDDKLVTTLIKTLEKHRVSFTANQEVPWNTLQSAIRDKLETEREAKADGRRIPLGKQVPRDLFNVYEGPEAKIDIKNIDTDKL